MKWPRQREWRVTLVIGWLFVLLCAPLPLFAQELEWTEVNTGLTDTEVFSFAVLGTTAYAGTQKGGVFRLEAGDSTWTPVNAGLSNINVHSLAVLGTTLYAGTWGGGIFRSRDKGNTWVSVGLKGGQIGAIAISSMTLYASFFGAGVFRSDDGGDTWILTAARRDAAHEWLGGSLAASTAVYASRWALHSSDAIYRSRDGGNTWETVGFIGQVLSLAASGTAVYAGTVYAEWAFQDGGVQRLEDRKDTWEHLGLKQMSVWSLAVSRKALYAGTDGQGVFCSKDEGKTWGDLGLADADTKIYSLAASDTMLYAGTSRGVFRASLPDDLRRTPVHPAGKLPVTWGWLKNAPAP
ncbi:hypothetical protein HYR99_28530 [Candidatus Poribacteria bacterium]|nr:hypothetical protein [Candidatus Poribacteria bacterium]